jgi:hypothetical protein
MTLFCCLEQLEGLVESCLLEPGGPLEPGWVSKGPVQRWERLEVFGDNLVQIKSPKSSAVNYCIVEMKGEGCSRYQQQLRQFVAAVEASGVRWRGKRLDVRWDHHRVSPRVVDEALRAGRFVSRCLNVGDRDWRDNSQGETAYLGNRKKLKHLRAYNMHGFNRLEVELAEEWAHDLLRKFVERPVEEFPGWLSGTCWQQ